MEGEKLLPGIGFSELMVILVIVLVIFGAGRLPQIGSGLGKAIRGFKDAIEGKDAIDVTPKKGETKEESKKGE
jgi:sec-independent protein translocase protein TatA